jgi:hypothetical protein
MIFICFVSPQEMMPFLIGFCLLRALFISFVFPASDLLAEIVDDDTL